MAVLDTPALNDFDQSRLWESMIGAETRSQYFAALVQVLRRRQRALTISSLVLSSGAAVSLLASSLQGHDWIKGIVALASAIFTAISLVSANEKSTIEASDLSYRWQTLADAYQQLWANMYDESAPQTLLRLREQEAAVSKSSTALPNVTTMMVKAEDNVTLHYTRQIAA